ncbi:hypothetical protein ACHAWF_002435 [Thalassiosira exigua]
MTSGPPTILYLSKADCERARLPILRPSTKRVSMANGHISHRKQARLPFKGLSDAGARADSLDHECGQDRQRGAVSIFTRHGITAYKQSNVLITCRGELLLVDIHDEKGCYMSYDNRNAPPSEYESRSSRPTACTACLLSSRPCARCMTSVVSL